MTDRGLTLELLGPFHASVPPLSILFRTEKVRALLAYLAVEAGRPHQRASLATLLWPDMLDSIALRNLRKTLHRLYEALAPIPGVDVDRLLLSTRRTIQLVGAECDVDVRTFQHLLDESATHPHQGLHLCTECMDRLTRATTLYRGELLAGFHLPDAEPFEEWLLLKREMLLHRVLWALYALTEAHLERGEYESAYTCAARQVELDPGREEAHGQAIRALALSGQRAEALAYAGRARRMMLEALGVEPALETLALPEGLVANGRKVSTVPTEPASQGQPARLVNLPTHLTPFIGRERELRQVMEYLRGPDCRLVSILGPGGMGKTRLALQTAEQVAAEGSFADGVTLIALSGVETDELLPATILTALGVQSDSGIDTRRQLLDYLAQRECLLVLDNLEQLVGQTQLLVDILVGAPGVRLLITSRVPLRLQAEQRVLLEGLDYPESGELLSENRPIEAEAVAESPSVRLFVQAARRVDPTFRLSPSNQGDVLRICRLVGGMPLALELAAPWVRMMDCAAIVASIERSPALLETDVHDVPDRHRSIERVLAQSWELLTPRERAALARLSVFRDSFDLYAAVQVCGASAIDLASLLDSGLVHRSPGGRYQLHELLSQFAAAAAAAELPALDLDDVRARHSRYYLGLVADREAALFGPDAGRAARGLLVELGNLRQSFLWASQHEEPCVLLGCLEGMARYWELNSLSDTADTLLTSGVAAVRRRLDTAADDPAMVHLLSRLLAFEAHVKEVRNQIDEAVRLAEEALRLAERVADGEGQAIAKNVLGEVQVRRREFDLATRYLKEAGAYFAAANDRRGLARSLRLLGTAQWRAGDYDAAAASLREARSLQESLGDRRETAHIAYALAGVAFERAAFAEARVWAEEALRLYEACGDRRHIARVKGSTSLLYLELQQFELALGYNQSHVDYSREMGDSHSLTIALGNRAAILQEAHRHEEALECLREAIEVAERAGNTWEVARLTAAVARLMHLRGALDLAIAYYEQALPVLRAGGAPYYAVEPLLDAAELQIERGLPREAAALLREGADLATELGLDDEILRAGALEARIAALEECRPDTTTQG